MEAERLSPSITIEILCFDWLIHPGVSYSREISGDRTREGFSFVCFLCKKVQSVKTKRMASTEEEFRQVSYFISMHFNF